MIRTAFSALLLAATPAWAVPGGKLDTLDAGSYVCELPGDAAGAAGLRQPDEAFDIVNANTYRSPTGRGSYLLTGDILTMTSGPKRGTRYHRLSDRFLRLIGPDGKDSALRCVRRVVNNG
ncbi:hypothetical protein [Novosphingobium sp.]|uniref:hypothetical protein n=1 Tax=Novosphingobium sp. TaxID=1874826 RepID=UPI0025CFBD05|nr:hypothetical protein [Novosphingobium sp.]